MSLEAALSDQRAFLSLVDSRAAPIAEYLQEAADRESGGTKSSLRFENRPDHRNSRKIIPLFREPWWGVVVYSCFDSVNGTEVVTPAFAEPLSTSVAEHALRGLDPRIQGHRSMVGRARSRRSLISACAKAGRLEPVFTTPGLSFDERFDSLGRIHVYAWNRTTNFDALARGGVLRTDGVGFRPARAHLSGSSGPSDGLRPCLGDLSHFEQRRSVRSASEDVDEQLGHRGPPRWCGLDRRAVRQR